MHAAEPRSALPCMLWSDNSRWPVLTHTQGCLVLNEARALAYARCGNGASQAWSRTEATSTVLGFCGLFGANGLGGLLGGFSSGWGR
jgi:hypothetical protein